MNNTEARLLAALTSHNLSTADVDLDAALRFACDVEADYAQELTAADWDTVINSYSRSGLVIC